MFEFLSSKCRLILKNEIGQELEHVLRSAEDSFQTLVDVVGGQCALHILRPTRRDKNLIELRSQYQTPEMQIHPSIRQDNVISEAN